MQDLDFITVGMVIDMYSESANDHEEYEELATQEDMDNF
jgi:hypothetical protein